MAKRTDNPGKCALCGCELNRSGEYATQTPTGRSHATEHHYVAERFFGRTRNNPKKQLDPTFDECPWGCERQTAVFCYECHEMILHNPVFLPEDIERFADLVRHRGYGEDAKTDDRTKLADRVKLLHEVIRAGLDVLDRPEPT